MMARKPRLVLSQGDTSPLGYVEESRRRATPDEVEHQVRAGNTALAFQPVLCAKDRNKVLYYEGLIRVFDRRERVIPAHDFIHWATNRETGRLIDLQSLTKTIAELRRVPGLHLSVNTSARSIGYAPWTNQLHSALRKWPDLAKRMTIEISEPSVMQLPEIASRFINDVSQRGVRFSLDDFGSDTSSLAMLRDIAFDSVKLDGGFVRGVAQNQKNQSVVLGVSAMALHFGMNVIAEHVETDEDLQWLQQSGIVAVQGYLFVIPTLKPAWRQAHW